MEYTNNVDKTLIQDLRRTLNIVTQRSKRQRRQSKQHGMRRIDVVGSVSERIDEVENHEFAETDWQQHGAAADYFERRSRIWIRLSKGDAWVAVGTYLVLISIAIVVL